MDSSDLMTPELNTEELTISPIEAISSEETSGQNENQNFQFAQSLSRTTDGISMEENDPEILEMANARQKRGSRARANKNGNDGYNEFVQGLNSTVKKGSRATTKTPARARKGGSQSRGRSVSKGRKASKGRQASKGRMVSKSPKPKGRSRSRSARRR